MMDPKRKLKSALDAMESARGALQRAQHDVSDNHELGLAIAELNDAETSIRQALQGAAGYRHVTYSTTRSARREPVLDVR